MSKNLYVGNLSYDTTEDTLRTEFAEFGEIESVNLITDRYTGRSRGFAFVEMTNSQEALQAIEELDSADIAGRPIRVNEARPRHERSR